MRATMPGYNAYRERRTTYRGVDAIINRDDGELRAAVDNLSRQCRSEVSVARESPWTLRVFRRDSAPLRPRVRRRRQLRRIETIR